jgi:hypothetical protein
MISFVSNLLKKIRGPVGEKLFCYICDQCRLVIGQGGHGEYYQINGGYYCSLGCYNEFTKKVMVPKAKKISRKTKKKIPKRKKK